MTSLLRFDVMPDALLKAQAAACVRSGGSVIFPTDTVYGIGCDPENQSAVQAIYAAKRRSPDKPLAIHIAVAEQLDEFAQALTPAARAIVARLWPGPIAIVVVRKPGRCAPAALGGQTISVRCPAHPACAAILESTGPLGATSANVSGQTAYAGGTAGLAALPEATLALIAGDLLPGQESTVLDCSAAAPKILRPGAVAKSTIQRALAGVASLSA
ncbi:MAG: L-threonylcarbamoyladenylate synthase [Candidatus Eremiobacteraeota bacterium]|nr:L-threonylcarbamoyladenylate synthase [Candidatus Eremiobacteraeota bacterium]